MPPQVSVVSAVYNQRPFLHQRVASILRQSSEDWEWIIVDDCSTDGSYELLRELTAHEKRIKLLRNESNLGISKSNQRAIDEATGAFLYRTDGDDYCYPEFLERTASLLHHDPCLAFVAVRSLKMDRHDRVSRITSKKPDWDKCGREVFEHNIVSYQFRSPSLVFRTDTVRRARGFDNIPVQTSQDWALALRCCTLGNVSYRDDRLAAYRYHPSMTSNRFVMSAAPHQLVAEHFAPIDDGLAWAKRTWPDLDIELLDRQATQEHAIRLLNNAARLASAGRHEAASVVVSAVRDRLARLEMPGGCVPSKRNIRESIHGLIHSLVPKRKLPRAWVPEWDNVLS
ncbi:MAG: glycosyltransferase family 2 protein [Armatimonadetes bacterium]|nr:glycosyltransferase family 2 protein [Armatimonadota bacterium]